MAVTAILLGHQLDMPGILPAAFYSMNALYVRDLLTDRGLDQAATITDNLAFEMSRLPADLLLRWSQGREWLQRQFLFLMQAQLHPLARKHTPCDEQSVCSQEIKKWWDKNLLRYALDETPRGDTLCTLETLSNAVDTELQVVCHGCRKGVKEAFRMARLYIWSELPIYFGTNNQENTMVTRWELFL